MTKKLTKRDLFELAFDIVSDSDAVPSDKEIVCDFIVHEIALLDKKRNAPRVPTETQLENEKVKETILADLAINGSTRAGDLAKRLDLSTQKVSALLRQLVLSGDVTRVEDKKVVTFTKS